jgi:hypothetical protein
MITVGEAEAFLAQDLSDLDFTQFRPPPTVALIHPHRPACMYAKHTANIRSEYAKHTGRNC